MTTLDALPTHIDIDELLADYDVVAAEHAPIDGGNTNWSFRVTTTDGHPLVATLCLEQDRAAVIRLAALLRHLERHDVSTNRLVPTRDGHPLGTFRGFPVMLKTWLDGDVVEAHTCHQLHRIGQEMARLHAVPMMAGLPRDHVYGLDKVDVVLRSGADPAFCAQLAERLPRLSPPPDLPRGLVHGDVFFDNLVVGEGDTVHILDFEEAAEHAFAFDLGMAVVGLCLRDDAPAPERVTALLAGYTSARPLSDIEHGAVQTYAEIAALACATWRFWRFHISWPQPDRQHLHMEMAAAARGIAACEASVFRV